MLSGVKSKFQRLTSVLTSLVMTFIMLCVPYSSATAVEEGYADNDLKERANKIALLINEARAENGLPPVYVLPYLNDKARERSREAIFDFSHTRPDGSRFSSILDTNLVDYSFAGENLAAGYDDPEKTFQQWKESPGHWSLILKKGITHIGIGCSYEQNSKYKWYWQITFVTTKNEFREQYIPARYAVEPKCSGDLNGDGVLDVYDYVVLEDFLRKTATNKKALSDKATEEEAEQYFPVYLNPAQWEAADCYVDSEIYEYNQGVDVEEKIFDLNFSDAKYLRRYLLGECKELPEIKD